MQQARVKNTRAMRVMQSNMNPLNMAQVFSTCAKITILNPTKPEFTIQQCLSIDATSTSEKHSRYGGDAKQYEPPQHGASLFDLCQENNS